MFYLHPAGAWGFARVTASGDGAAIELGTGRLASFQFNASRWGQVASSPAAEHFASLGHRRTADERAVYCLWGWKMTDSGPERVWEVVEQGEAAPLTVAFAGPDALVCWATSTGFYEFFDESNPPACTQLRVHSTVDGRLITAVDAPPDYLLQTLASPDGEQFIARADRRMWVYDTSDWLKPPTVVEGKVRPSSMAYHPSGRYILAANNGPMVHALDPSTFRVLQKWKWGVGGILRTVAVSPDGTLAAAAGPSGKIVVWDLDL